jgi:hypothetical protein
MTDEGLHADDPYRDSLVWDVIERHRAEVDYMVLAFLERMPLRRADFVQARDRGVSLHPQCCRVVAASCSVPAALVQEDVTWLRDLLLASAAEPRTAGVSTWSSRSRRPRRSRSFA